METKEAIKSEHLEKKVEVPKVRKFLGTIVTKDNYRQILNEGGRDLINFHNKHLKAYQNGKYFFYHGKDEKQNKILRIVQQNFVEE